MKKIFRKGLWVILGILTLVACTPQEDSDYSLGAAPQESDLAFTAIPSAANANIIEFVNTSKRPGIATWNLGNGVTKTGETARGIYAAKGDYTVTMTLYTDGGSLSKALVVNIAADDFSLLDTPMFNALTGGKDAVEGKTWVFDQYHAGHFGVGPADGEAPSWWAAGPNDKLECSLYSNKFTFFSKDVKMIWENNGSVYTNGAGKDALAGLGYSNAVVPPAGDFDVEYAPKASYTYILNETAMTLKISDGGFFGHYCGVSEYEILMLSENELYLKARSATESGNGWWYRFIPEELNVAPSIPLKAIELKEDFEEAKPKVSFQVDAMGLLTTAGYSNPAPVPINQSKLVYLYQKANDFYSNIFFVGTGYKFDLAEVNKVKIKVFIPSYNDYTTANNVAGDWISNPYLKPQLAVKLQNNDLGGNAWSTQAEIVKGDLEMDKWIDLEFDFSGVKDRVDFDKIVIQFGAEGQDGEGIFFFDDFEFTK